MEKSEGKFFNFLNWAIPEAKENINTGCLKIMRQYFRLILLEKFMPQIRITFFRELLDFDENLF